MAAEYQKTAAAIKSWAIEIVQEYVYEGEFDKPKMKPDATGRYTYRDRKVQISCALSPREGWNNCSVDISVLRRRWGFRRPELVMSAGYGIEVTAFRPGRWIDYLAGKVEEVRQIQKDRGGADIASRDKSGNDDGSFSPIDDSAIFK